MKKAAFAGKLLRELVEFARENKAYWIVPLALFLGLCSVMIVVSQGAAPLLYTIF